MEEEHPYGAPGVPLKKGASLQKLEFETQSYATGRGTVAGEKYS